MKYPLAHHALRPPSLRRLARHLTCALLLAPTLGCGDDAKSETTYASWAASPQDYAEELPFPGAPAPEAASFTDQTLRQIVHLSAGGEALRVQLSNLFGTAPLDIDAVGVALSSGGAAIDASTHVALTFGGAPQVTLAAGEERWSDLVPVSVPSGTNLAVSLHVADTAPVSTVHTLGQQTAYIAPGNSVATATLASSDTRQSYYWLSRVDVRAAAAPRVIVAFGDSITDGFNSTPDASHRYPNYLSERLLTASDSAAHSVVNAGISGNRVLSNVIGPAGVARFQRDVLGQTGVSDVVILLGINDIGFSGFAPEQAPSAEQISAGLERLVNAADAAGVRVHLGTLLPFGGAMAPYYSEAGEAKRQAVNAWIRANTVAASIIDFDQRMQDPANPGALLPAFDSGDGLHPNDDGYSAMAEAVYVTAIE